MTPQSQLFYILSPNRFHNPALIRIYANIVCRVPVLRHVLVAHYWTLDEAHFQLSGYIVSEKIWTELIKLLVLLPYLFRASNSKNIEQLVKDTRNTKLVSLKW